MLIYEKKVGDERKLFGTMGNIPAAADVELTYKDSTGTVITPIDKDTYRDASVGGTQFIKRDSDKKNVNVFIGDNCVIGKVTPVVAEAPKKVKAVKEVAVKNAEVKEEPKAEEEKIEE